MNKLIFRADGNAQIGLGHVMRCLALADMLGDAFECRFAIVQPGPEVRALIESKNRTLVPLLTNDVGELLPILSADDIAILDGYGFDASYQRTVRETARRLVFIDDLIAGRQVADVIINHAGGIGQTDYDAEAYTEFCLGPHYALLRPEFLRPQSVGASPGNGPVFVSLGGADPHNQSMTVLEAIEQVDATLPVRLVLGPFHPDRPAIEGFRNRLPNLTILQNLDAGQLVAELRQCSLAITACSTIAYEVCAVNRPLIALVTAANQERLAQFLAEEKLALSVNFPNLLSRLSPSVGVDTALKLAIQSFQFMPDTVADTLMNQRRFFDGRSPERFRNVFNRLC